MDPHENQLTNANKCDLYGDLSLSPQPENEEGEDLALFEELITSEGQEKDRNLEKSLKQTKEELVALTKRCKELDEDNVTLLKNMSSLWKTALSQINGKDRKIETLNKQKQALTFKKGMNQVPKDEFFRVAEHIAAYTSEELGDFLKTIVSQRRCKCGWNAKMEKNDLKLITSVLETVRGKRINHKNAKDGGHLERLMLSHGKSITRCVDENFEDRSVIVRPSRNKGHFHGKGYQSNFTSHDGKHHSLTENSTQDRVDTTHSIQIKASWASKNQQQIGVEKATENVSLSNNDLNPITDENLIRNSVYARRKMKKIMKDKALRCGTMSSILNKFAHAEPTQNNNSKENSLVWNANSSKQATLDTPQLFPNVAEEKLLSQTDSTAGLKLEGEEADCEAVITISPRIPKIKTNHPPKDVDYPRSVLTTRDKNEEDKLDRQFYGKRSQDSNTLQKNNASSSQIKHDKTPKSQSNPEANQATETYSRDYDKSSSLRARDRRNNSKSSSKKESDEKQIAGVRRRGRWSREHRESPARSKRRSISPMARRNHHTRSYSNRETNKVSRIGSSKDRHKERGHSEKIRKNTSNVCDPEEPSEGEVRYNRLRSTRCPFPTYARERKADTISSRSLTSLRRHNERLPRKENLHRASAFRREVSRPKRNYTPIKKGLSSKTSPRKPLNRKLTPRKKERSNRTPEKASKSTSLQKTDGSIGINFDDKKSERSDQDEYKHQIMPLPDNKSSEKSSYGHDTHRHKLPVLSSEADESYTTKLFTLVDKSKNSIILDSTSSSVRNDGVTHVNNQFEVQEACKSHNLFEDEKRNKPLCSKGESGNFEKEEGELSSEDENGNLSNDAKDVGSYRENVIKFDCGASNVKSPEAPTLTRQNKNASWLKFAASPEKPPRTDIGLCGEKKSFYDDETTFDLIVKRQNENAESIIPGSDDSELSVFKLITNTKEKSISFDSSDVVCPSPKLFIHDIVISSPDHLKNEPACQIEQNAPLSNSIQPSIAANQLTIQNPDKIAPNNAYCHSPSKSKEISLSTCSPITPSTPFNNKVDLTSAITPNDNTFGEQLKSSTPVVAFNFEEKMRSHLLPKDSKAVNTEALPNHASPSPTMAHSSTTSQTKKRVQFITLSKEVSFHHSLDSHDSAFAFAQRLDDIEKNSLNLSSSGSSSSSWCSTCTSSSSSSNTNSNCQNSSRNASSSPNKKNGLGINLLDTQATSNIFQHTTFTTALESSRIDSPGKAAPQEAKMSPSKKKGSKSMPSIFSNSETSNSKSPVKSKDQKNLSAPSILSSDSSNSNHARKAKLKRVSSDNLEISESKTQDRAKTPNNVNLLLSPLSSKLKDPQKHQSPLKFNANSPKNIREQIHSPSNSNSPSKAKVQKDGLSKLNLKPFKGKVQDLVTTSLTSKPTSNNNVKESDQMLFLFGELESSSSTSPIGNAETGSTQKSCVDGCPPQVTVDAIPVKSSGNRAQESSPDSLRTIGNAKEPCSQVSDSFKDEKIQFSCTSSCNKASGEDVCHSSFTTFDNCVSSSQFLRQDGFDGTKSADLRILTRGVVFCPQVSENSAKSSPLNQIKIFKKRKRASQSPIASELSNKKYALNPTKRFKALESPMKEIFTAGFPSSSNLPESKAMIATDLSPCIPSKEPLIHNANPLSSSEAKLVCSNDAPKLDGACLQKTIVNSNSDKAPSPGRCNKPPTKNCIIKEGRNLSVEATAVYQEAESKAKAGTESINPNPPEDDAWTKSSPKMSFVKKRRKWVGSSFSECHTSISSSKEDASAIGPSPLDEVSDVGEEEAELISLLARCKKIIADKTIE